MQDPHVQNLLATFSTKRILVVGDVILDEYLWGDVKRISPEAPVPIVEVHSRTFVPGGAGNAAANIVSLTGQVLLGAAVGRDGPAEILGEVLRQHGVPTDGLVAEKERLTTTKTRLIARGQQVVRMDCEHRAPLPHAVEDVLLHWVDRLLPDVDACILSDYGKGVVSSRLAGHFIRAARQAGKPVVVDPKGTNYARYRGATLVKPNVHELERVVKEEIHDEATLLEAGARLMDLLEGTALLITRGAEGMSLLRKDCPPLHAAAVARTVFDVTGAGDTVVGTLALALAAGSPLEQAVLLANRAAGIAVGKRGTASVTLEELRKSMSS